MNEAQQPRATAAPAAAPPAPITSLKGYWAIVLPLIALAAQFVLGLIIGLILGASGLDRAATARTILLAVAGSAALSYLVIVHVLLTNRRWRWSDLGWRASTAGPIVVAVAIGIVTALLAATLESAVREAGGSLFQGLSAPALLVTVLVIGVLVPFAEELMFRGIVYPVLRARIGDTLGAILVSALIFGAFHIYPLQIVVGFCLGVPLAWLRHWSGALWAPIALHMTHNVGVVVLAAFRVV